MSTTSRRIFDIIVRVLFGLGIVALPAGAMAQTETRQDGGVLFQVSPESLAKTLQVNAPPYRNPKHPRGHYLSKSIRCPIDEYAIVPNRRPPSDWKPSVSSVSGTSGRRSRAAVEDYAGYGVQLMCYSRVAEVFGVVGNTSENFGRAGYFYHRDPPEDMPICWTNGEEYSGTTFLCRPAGAFVEQQGEDTVDPSFHFSVSRKYVNSRRPIGPDNADFWWKADNPTNQSLVSARRAQAQFAPLAGKASLRKCMTLVDQHKLTRIAGDRLRPGTRWCYKIGNKNMYGWMEIRSRPGRAPSKLHFYHRTWTYEQPYFEGLRP